MANFLNEIKDNLSSVADPNQIFNKGIDRGRTTFLKGLKTTSSGQKEDPTYTGFRIMFDMGYGGLVDPESYLPISPLFSNGSSQIVGPVKGMKTPEPIPRDFFNLSQNKIRNFYLGVHISNKFAINLYRKLGFKNFKKKTKTLIMRKILFN